MAAHVAIVVGLGAALLACERDRAAVRSPVRPRPAAARPSGREQTLTRRQVAQKLVDNLRLRSDPFRCFPSPEEMREARVTRMYVRINEEIVLPELEGVEIVRVRSRDDLPARVTRAEPVLLYTDVVVDAPSRFEGNEAVGFHCTEYRRWPGAALREDHSVGGRVSVGKGGQLVASIGGSASCYFAD